METWMIKVEEIGSLESKIFWSEKEKQTNKLYQLPNVS
jgi:hypothetical protein